MFSFATVCVRVRDVHYKCDITLRFATFRLLRRVSVLIARFSVVLRVRRDSHGRGERRLVLLEGLGHSPSYGRQVKFVTYSRRESRERSADSRH
jgi:hypothetical protein